MRIAICDDERLYIKSLRSHIESWISLHNHYDIYIQEYISAEDLLEDWHQKRNYDLLFLDIQMPDGLNGFSLAQEIRKTDSQAIIVFITNLSSYVYAAYDVEALRYIVKPFSPTRIYEILDISYHRTIIKNHDCLLLTSKKQTIVLKTHEILYAEVLSHTVILHKVMSSDSIETRMRFSELVAKLPPQSFVQVHRSVIVNISYITRLNRSSLKLIDGTTIPISRKYRTDVCTAFRMFYTKC